MNSLIRQLAAAMVVASAVGFGAFRVHITSQIADRPAQGAEPRPAPEPQPRPSPRPVDTGDPGPKQAVRAGIAAPQTVAMAGNVR
jgi:hypothetical protein